MKKCQGTLSGQGCGVLFDCQGDEWLPCYAGLHFPLAAPRWLLGRTTTATSRTLLILQHSSQHQ